VYYFRRYGNTQFLEVQSGPVGLLNVSFREDVSLSASALEQNMTIHFLGTAIQATNRTEKV
jgi:hypothetical protein